MKQTNSNEACRQGADDLTLTMVARFAVAGRRARPMVMVSGECSLFKSIEMVF